MKKIAYCLILICSSIMLSAAAYEPRDVTVQNALQKFYDKYRQAGCLSEAHLKKLNIDFSRIAQSADDGYATLQLIEWLEKQQDDVSKALLAAVNELCYLRFVLFLSLFEQSEHALVIEKLHYLANREVLINDISTNPFKTALSKMLLTVAIINAKKMKCAEKKEFLVHALSAVEINMLKINNGLGVDKVHEDDIRALVAFLEAYGGRFSGARVPVLKITAMVVAVILVGMIIYYWPELKLATGRRLEDLAGFIRVHFMRPLVAGVSADIQQQVPVLAGSVQAQIDPLIAGAVRSAGQQLPALRAGAQAQIDPLIERLFVSIAQRLSFLARGAVFVNGGLPQQPQPPAQPQGPQQGQGAPQNVSGLNGEPDFGQ